MKIERGGLPDGIHIETLGNTSREAAEAIAPIAKDLRSRVLSIATAFRGINGCEWLRSLAAVVDACCATARAALVGSSPMRD